MQLGWPQSEDLLCKSSQLRIEFSAGMYLRRGSGPCPLLKTGELKRN